MHCRHVLLSLFATTLIAACDGGDGTSASAPAPPPAPAPPVTTLPACTRQVSSLDFSGTSFNAGDIVCVKGGTYAGGFTLSGHSGVTFRNHDGPVVINGVVALDRLTNVTFDGRGDASVKYGFQFRGGNGGFTVASPLSGLKILNLESVGAGILLDAGHTGVTWNGSPATLALHQTTLDHIHLASSDKLVQGNWGSLDTFQNFISEIEMSNIAVEDAKGEGQIVVRACGLFNANVHDWTVVNPSNVTVGSANDLDSGIVQLCGGGSFSRMHRRGGWGWLVRDFGAQLGPNVGEFRCENNVDVDTQYYGTCESRNVVDPTLAGRISSVNITISNNTSARKGDLKGAYTTAIALLPQVIAGTTATVQNNTLCQVAEDGGAVNGVLAWSMLGTLNASGNRVLGSCAGLIDPITGGPL